MDSKPTHDQYNMVTKHNGINIVQLNTVVTLNDHLKPRLLFDLL